MNVWSEKQEKGYKNMKIKVSVQCRDIHSDRGTENFKLLGRWPKARFWVANSHFGKTE